LVASSVGLLSPPVGAIIVALDPPTVTHVLVDPVDARRVAVVLHLPSHFLYRPGALVVLESEDGGESFTESVVATGALLPEVSEEWPPPVVALIERRREIVDWWDRPIETAVDGALAHVDALDREAFLREHPALDSVRSPLWMPTFLVLAVAALLLPFFAYEVPKDRDRIGRTIASAALLFWACVFLNVISFFGDLAACLRMPGAGAYLATALRCANEPAALAGLVVIASLFLPTFPGVLAHNRWRRVALGTLGQRIWLYAAIAFWLAVLCAALRSAYLCV